MFLQHKKHSCQAVLIQFRFFSKTKKDALVKSLDPTAL